MAEPQPESEAVVAAHLKQFDCPFLPTDPRARAYMLGVRKGIAMGKAVSLEVIRQTCAEINGESDAPKD